MNALHTGRLTILDSHRTEDRPHFNVSELGKDLAALMKKHRIETLQSSSITLHDEALWMEGTVILADHNGIDWPVSQSATLDALGEE